MQKIITHLCITLVIVAGIFSFAYYKGKDTSLGRPIANSPSVHTNKNASTTSYTITTGASVRVLATSSKRVSFVISPGCLGGPLWINTDEDAPAVIGTGMIATSGANFIVPGAVPIAYQGAVQAIASSSNCSNVNITEYVED